MVFTVDVMKPRKTKYRYINVYFKSVAFWQYSVYMYGYKNVQGVPKKKEKILNGYNFFIFMVGK